MTKTPASLVFCDRLRDLRGVERMHDLVPRIGVVVEERVDVLLRVRDRLAGRERRRETRIARHVADEHESLLLRLGRERRVLRRADLVVDLDGVVAGGGLPVDLGDGLLGSPRAVEHRPRGVDRRTEERAGGDPLAPGEVRGAAIEVEDGRHTVQDVHREVLLGVEVRVHVGESRGEIEAARVHDARPLGHRRRRGGAQRRDAAGRDHDRLVAQDPRRVHRHHRGVHERDRPRSRSARLRRRVRRRRDARGEQEHGGKRLESSSRHLSVPWSHSPVRSPRGESSAAARFGRRRYGSDRRRRDEVRVAGAQGDARGWRGHRARRVQAAEGRVATRTLYVLEVRTDSEPGAFMIVYPAAARFSARASNRFARNDRFARSFADVTRESDSRLPSHDGDDSMPVEVSRFRSASRLVERLRRGRPSRISPRRR